MKSSKIAIAMAWWLAIASGTPAAAQPPIAYPAKGQTPQQQQKDQGECQGWAKQTTGVDPVAVAQAPPPPPQSGQTGGGGERIRGAARGAAGGAIGGAIAGDAGEGAAIGAVVGTIAGGAKARRNKRAQQEQATQQHQAQQQSQIGTYNRAFAACMEGRGYTTK
jgi:hypothetical protein